MHNIWKLLYWLKFSFKRLVKRKYTFKKDRKSSSKKKFKDGVLWYFSTYPFQTGRTHIRQYVLPTWKYNFIKIKIEVPLVVIIMYPIVQKIVINYLDSDCLPDPPTPIRSIWLSGCFRTLEIRHKCSRAKLKSTKSIGFLLTALCLTRRSSATPLKWKIFILLWY